MGKEKRTMEEPRYAPVFTITARCNDDCGICIKADFIKARPADLSLDEIRKNYSYLKKKYKLHHVVLSGGEPSLHPQIFEILDFFKAEGVRLRLLTNLLKFNDKAFFDRFYPYFSGKDCPNQIEASLNDLPQASRAADLRLNGLLRLIEHKLPVELITVVSRDNLKDLPKLVFLVKCLLKTHYPRESFSSKISSWELRSLYLPETPAPALERSLPRNFNEFRNSVERALAVLDAQPAIKALLWHLPLCYFGNYSLAALGSMRRRMTCANLWVDKSHQLGGIKLLTRPKSYKACRGCGLADACTGRCNTEYMEKYGFPPFKPVRLVIA